MLNITHISQVNQALNTAKFPMDWHRAECLPQGVRDPLPPLSLCRFSPVKLVNEEEEEEQPHGHERRHLLPLRHERHFLGAPPVDHKPTTRAVP